MDDGVTVVVGEDERLGTVSEAGATVVVRAEMGVVVDDVDKESFDVVDWCDLCALVEVAVCVEVGKVGAIEVDLSSSLSLACVVDGKVVVEAVAVVKSVNDDDCDCVV